MTRLASPAIRAADPSLDNLDRLKTRWMNGIVFFLREDVPVVHGHVIYIDSAWSLTSISPRQFWDQPMDSFGDGEVGGILSVDVSDWTTPGPITGKPAMQCSKTEVFTEVWAQLKAHLNSSGPAVLDDSNLIRWFLDTDVRFPELRRSWQVRETSTSSRSSSILRDPGRGGRTRPQPSRTSSSPATTCAPTRTWPQWRAPTRRPAERLTTFSTAPARLRRVVRSGRWKSPPYSPPPGRSTSGATSEAGAISFRLISRRRIPGPERRNERLLADGEPVRMTGTAMRRTASDL